jgi:hypothetical protein
MYVVMNVMIICFFVVVTHGGTKSEQHISVLVGLTFVGYGYYRQKLLGLTSVRPSG